MNSEIGNHYLPDTQNAHIDTSDFEKELEELYGSLEGDELEDANLWGETYQRVIARISSPPDEPNDDELICRYLTPTKFIWFANQNSVYFCGADKFEDKKDSGLPEDYKNSILKTLHNRDVIPLTWDAHLDTMRSHWLISCWTSLDNHYDDYLLWHRYAGSEHGIGVVINYDSIKHHLSSVLSKEENVSNFQSGYVGYKHPLRSPPFNKRNIFRNEKEVRFVCSTDLLSSISVDVSALKKMFSLRFSPDVSQGHVDSVLAIWKKMGGGDEYYIAGD